MPHRSAFTYIITMRIHWIILPSPKKKKHTARAFRWNRLCFQVPYLLSGTSYFDSGCLPSLLGHLAVVLQQALVMSHNSWFPLKEKGCYIYLTPSHSGLFFGHRERSVASQLPPSGLENTSPNLALLAPHLQTLHQACHRDGGDISVATAFTKGLFGGYLLTWTFLHGANIWTLLFRWISSRAYLLHLCIFAFAAVLLSLNC